MQPKDLEQRRVLRGGTATLALGGMVQTELEDLYAILHPNLFVWVEAARSGTPVSELPPYLQRWLREHNYDKVDPDTFWADVRKVVLAAAEGEGDNLVVGSPFATS